MPLFNSKPTSADSAHRLSHSSQWRFISFFSTTITSLTSKKDHKLSPNKDLSLLSSTNWQTLAAFSEVGCFVFSPRKCGKPISQSPFSPFIPQEVSSFLHLTTPSPAPLVPIVFSKSWGKMPGNFLQANGCKENCTKTLQNYNPSVLI